MTALALVVGAAVGYLIGCWASRPPRLTVEQLVDEALLPRTEFEVPGGVIVMHGRELTDAEIEEFRQAWDAARGEPQQIVRHAPPRLSVGRMCLQCWVGKHDDCAGEPCWCTHALREEDR